MADRPFTLRIFNTYVPGVTTFFKDLIPYWERLGWQVEVILSRTEYREGRSNPWIGPNTRVRWTKSPSKGAQSRFAKLMVMISYIFTAASLSLFLPRADRNLFITQPPLFYLWGYILRFLRREPYFVVLMDLYPEVAIEAGLLPSESSTTRILSKLAHFGIQKADGVFVIGRYMHKLVREIGVEENRIHLIPNWGDQNAGPMIPAAENNFRREHGWENKFVVLYSGNIGTAHYFDDFLEVARRLQDRSELIFVFIGRGQRHKEIVEYKDRHDLDNIVLLPFQPLEKLPETLSAGDLHFVSLREGYEGLVVPSKIYNIMTVGRPTLYQGVPWGEIALMIAEEDIGCVLEQGNPDLMERALLNYMADSELLQKQGQKAKQLVAGRYGTDHACRSYTDVLAAPIS